MSKFVVIVFPTEDKAYQATRELKELHAEGSLTVYGVSVIAKDAQGKLSIKDSADAGPLGAGVGALVGGLAGLIAGPFGALAGVTTGAYLGMLADIFNLGIGQDFVAKVSDELGQGKTAVIAEIDEDWTTPLNTRMESLGGSVLRTWRSDFEDERIAQEVAAEKADFEQLQREYAQASAEAKTKLKARLDQAKADLAQAQKRLNTRLDSLEKERTAKIAALEQQVTKAQTAAKEEIKRRVDTARADYQIRSAKLKQAWAMTKEALAA